MSVNDLLSQDEIDALLHGVSSDEIETRDDADNGEVRDYDFFSGDRVVRGRMPTLEMINERYARLFRGSLFELLRRRAEIAVSSVQVLKFSDYVHSLYMPTHINLVKAHPLRGTALFVFDPEFVFTVVDNYFGGDGRYQGNFDEREFSPAEMRVIQIILEQVFVDLKEAWAPVFDLDFEYSSSEVNPQLANIINPAEMVVVSIFHVELEGGAGNFHVAMPYSMLEPIRAIRGAGLQSEVNGTDERWISALRDEIEQAEVNLTCRLTEATLNLRDIMHVKVGDIIPIEMSMHTTICAEGVPVLRGNLGVSRGNNAVKVVEQVKFPKRELRNVGEEVIHEKK